MPKMYKLLNQNMTSHGGMKWEFGKENKALEAGTNMCTAQVLHCYNNPVLAVLFNPIHANIKNPRLFEIATDKIVASDGLKYATKRQTIIKELQLPEITVTQRVAFAIKCALLVCDLPSFVRWAERWLSGDDRTADAATAATATRAAATAAYAAAAATRAAATAAYAAADSAAYAAAAYAAADSAAYAAADSEFDFVTIITEVLDNF